MKNPFRQFSLQERKKHVWKTQTVVFDVKRVYITYGNCHGCWQRPMHGYSMVKISKRSQLLGEFLTYSFANRPSKQRCHNRQYVSNKKMRHFTRNGSKCMYNRKGSENDNYFCNQEGLFGGTHIFFNCQTSLIIQLTIEFYAQTTRFSFSTRGM